LSTDPHPSVSTGSVEETFVTSVIEAAKDLRKTGMTDITIIWNGRKFTMYVEPTTVFGYGKKIEGRARQVAAKYLVWRDNNPGCSIRSPMCQMGGAPFADPARADFDHINGKDREHMASNLRLACHSCNSHIQNEQRFHWKHTAEPTSAGTGVSERESLGRAEAWSSREGEQGELQQDYWDKWVRRDDKDSPWFKLGVKRGEWVRMIDVLDLAPREIGRLYTISKKKFGSSVTYRRYMMEDRFSVLELTKDGGRWMVRYRGENEARDVKGERPR